jgi:hypothetical protein
VTLRVLLVLALASVAWAQVRSQVDQVGPKLPPKDKKCDVQFFQDKPPEAAHEAVADIRVYITRNKLVTKAASTSEDAKREFQKQACRVGADAVLIAQPTVSNSGESQTFYIKGTAIHFTK